MKLESNRLPLRELEMGQLMRDYEITKANYQSLFSKKLSAEMGTDLERRQKSERFTVIEPARIPAAPIKPNRRLLNVMGCGLGLLFGLVIAFGNELRRNVLLGAWELPADTVVLGVLPNIGIGKRDMPSRQSGFRRSNLRIVVWSSALFVLALGCYMAAKRF